MNPLKVLLISVNASYMHTNLAIRCLKNYAEKSISSIKQNSILIELAEYTINQPAGEVLRNIGFTEADVILFSTYIWNAEYVSKILPEVKKILPSAIIGAGGPEFSYSPLKYLKSIPSLDFIMFGEGEETFTEFLIQIQKQMSASEVSIENENGNGTLLSILESITGLYFLNNGNLVFTGERPLIQDLDVIPFTYPELKSGNGNFDPDHKIYYYESSRGCPYSCAYCLSSIDKRVRFKSLERVKQELQIFLDANVKLVKFVDRTYNLKPERYIQIWKYILENHNGKTMFHFEIEAEYLTDEALEFLQKIPAGIMQFEMGVQSANKKTLESVNRSSNIEILAEKIRQIPRTIHQHLDLIAGLPHEDLESFGKSYDFVMNLRPDALQLGFLKVLEGTEMAKYASKNGWKWMETPVYETFSTPHLSFKDIAFLKDIETATDVFWNKKLFVHTMEYAFRTVSPWDFLQTFVEFSRTKDAFAQARKDSYWFQLLSEYFCQESFQSHFRNLDSLLLKELLKYDFVLSGKKGNFPEWYNHIYNKDNHRKMLEENSMLSNSRIGFAITEYEEFEYDVTQQKPEEHKGHIRLLIRY